jgi:DNA-binding transcriptional LysR family regulator
MQNLRRDLPSLNALAVFESAARQASFTRAAQELGMSQPAVTRHIKSLEFALDCPLFRRNHNRLTLTAEGLRLWSDVSEGLGGIAATISAIKAERARQTVVLASHAGFAQQWLMPRFSDLYAHLGGYDVRLQISDSDAEADRAGFDVSIRVGTGNWPDQDCQRLCAEAVRPVASPRLLQENPELAEASPADLLRAPLLHMDDGDKPWMTWRGWFAAMGVEGRPPKPRVFYYNYPLVLQQALTGKGVALGWRYLVDSHIAQGALVSIGPSVESPTAGYYLTWPRERADEQPVARIRDWLAGQFAA